MSLNNRRTERDMPSLEEGKDIDVGGLQVHRHDPRGKGNHVFPRARAKPRGKSPFVRGSVDKRSKRPGLGKRGPGFWGTITVFAAKHGSLERIEDEKLAGSSCRKG